MDEPLKVAQKKINAPQNSSETGALFLGDENKTIFVNLSGPGRKKKLFL